MGSRVKTLVYPVWITRAELKEGGRRDLVHRPTTYSMSFQFDHLHTLEKKKKTKGKQKGNTTHIYPGLAPFSTYFRHNTYFQ